MVKAKVKQKAEELKKYQEVQTWIKTVSKSSIPLYLNALAKFCEFTGKNHGELILMRDKEIRR